MSLPNRYESYKGFVITPFTVQTNDPIHKSAPWSVSGGFRPADSPSFDEESFNENGQFAATADEALEKAIAYAKRLIDARQAA